VALGAIEAGGGMIGGGVNPDGPPAHAAMSALEAMTALAATIAASSQRDRFGRDEVPIATKLGHAAPGAHGARAGFVGPNSPSSRGQLRQPGLNGAVPAGRHADR
jgi:hypothetical protein